MQSELIIGHRCDNNHHTLAAAYLMTHHHSSYIWSITVWLPYTWALNARENYKNIGYKLSPLNDYHWPHLLQANDYTDYSCNYWFCLITWKILFQIVALMRSLSSLEKCSDWLHSYLHKSFEVTLKSPFDMFVFIRIWPADKSTDVQRALYPNMFWLVKISVRERLIHLTSQIIFNSS